MTGARDVAKGHQRSGTLGTPLRLSEDTVPEMIRNRNGSPVAKAVSVEVALTLIEYANERDALRDLAKSARAIAAAPDYDEEAIRDALWAVVDAALKNGAESDG